MSNLNFRNFLRALALPPSPADITSVVQATPVWSAFTVLGASAFVLIAWPSLGGAWLLLWWGATLLAAGVVYQHAQKAGKHPAPRVSLRAARRLNQAAFAMALPWAALALGIIPTDNSEAITMVMVLLTGMMTGSALMLHRAMAAAGVYCATVLSGLTLACVMSANHGNLLLSGIATLFSGFALSVALNIGQTARQKDRAITRLSDAKKKLEHAYEQISAFAFIDPVTGLPNRKAFSERLQKELRLAREDGKRRAVLLFDLDGFKSINDTFGHQAGDELLRLVGERINAVIGPHGLTARLGGDEFAVVVGYEQNHIDLAHLAERLIAAVTQPAVLTDRQVFPGTSIGISVLPDHAQTTSGLMALADASLGRAKEMGKGGWHLFDEGLGRRLENSNKLADDLTHALADNQLAVHYQPQIDLHSGEMVGCEALVRWHHKTLGSIPPERFLPVASERALLQDLSGFIFNRVTEDILRWKRAGHDIGRVAINIHPIDLKSPDLLLKRIREMAQKGVGAEDVVLEITEGCFVGRGTETAPMILDAIADMGYCLSLDDFGTGHAALSYLRSLPVWEIKIDKGFVANIGHTSHDRAIVAATTAIAKGMGLRSVAEGVETLEQLLVLQEMGVEYAQGFYWEQAVPADQLAAFAKAHVPQAAVPNGPRLLMPSRHQSR